MSGRRRGHGRARGGARIPWRMVLVALVVAAVGAAASPAYALYPNVKIVTQGEPPPGEPPPHVSYFETIQSAVNATKRGDWVLIEPGVYTEEVKITKEHSHIWLRGMDGTTANTRDRCIYIHGTAEEQRIGSRASFGCIRMRSKDVLDMHVR